MFAEEIVALELAEEAGLPPDDIGSKIEAAPSEREPIRLSPHIKALPI